MVKIKYVNKKIFYKLTYTPEVYEYPPKAFVKRRNSVIVWLSGEFNENNVYITEDLIPYEIPNIYLEDRRIMDLMILTDSDEGFSKPDFVFNGGLAYIKSKDKYAYYSSEDIIVLFKNCYFMVTVLIMIIVIILK